MGHCSPQYGPLPGSPTKDGHVIIGANNDQQFIRLCEFAAVPELAKDERFVTNADA
jgi:crotonobetainyl-CoA:carnitine CoA-transferase CaiB-like acyl-CoA transferase